MEDKLFNTEKKIDAGLANFRRLVKSRGWLLFEKIIGENEEIVKNQILRGVEGETKDDIDKLRYKLQIYNEVLSTPYDIIEKLSTHEPPSVDHDPYD